MEQKDILKLLIGAGASFLVTRLFSKKNVIKRQFFNPNDGVLDITFTNGRVLKINTKEGFVDFDSLTA